MRVERDTGWPNAFRRVSGRKEMFLANFNHARDVDEARIHSGWLYMGTAGVQL